MRPISKQTKKQSCTPTAPQILCFCSLLPWAHERNNARSPLTSTEPFSEHETHWRGQHRCYCARTAAATASAGAGQLWRLRGSPPRSKEANIQAAAGRGLFGSAFSRRPDRLRRPCKKYATAIVFPRPRAEVPTASHMSTERTVARCKRCLRGGRMPSCCRALPMTARGARMLSDRRLGSNWGKWPVPSNLHGVCLGALPCSQRSRDAGESPMRDGFSSSQ